MFSTQPLDSFNEASLSQRSPILIKKVTTNFLRFPFPLIKDPTFGTNTPEKLHETLTVALEHNFGVLSLMWEEAHAQTAGKS